MVWSMTQSYGVIVYWPMPPPHRPGPSTPHRPGPSLESRSSGQAVDRSAQAVDDEAVPHQLLVWCHSHSTPSYSRSTGEPHGVFSAWLQRLGVVAVELSVLGIIALSPVGVSNVLVAADQLLILVAQSFCAVAKSSMVDGSVVPQPAVLRDLVGVLVPVVRRPPRSRRRGGPGRGCARSER